MADQTIMMNQKITTFVGHATLIVVKSKRNYGTFLKRIGAGKAEDEKTSEQKYLQFEQHKWAGDTQCPYFVFSDADPPTMPQQVTAFKEQACKKGIPLRKEHSVISPESFPYAKALLNGMELQCTEVPVTFVYNHVLKLEHLKDMRWLQTLEEMNLKANETTYNLIIHFCSKARRPYEAEEWFGQIRENGLTPDIKSYNNVIDAFASARLCAEAERWFQNLVGDGLVPNGVTYNCMAKACVNVDAIDVGAIDKAKAWLEKSENFYEKNREWPDWQDFTVAYKFVIDACLEADFVKKAAEVLQGFCKDFQANVMTVIGVARACIKSGSCKEAELLLTKLKVEDLNGTEYTSLLHTYTFLLKAYAKAGSFSQAESVFVILEREGLVDLFVFNILIDACAKAGRLREAEQFNRKLEERGLQADQVTHSSLLNAYAKAGFLSQAMDMLEELEKEGKTHVWNFNTLIDACAKAGRLDEAEQLYQKLEERGLQADQVTHTILLIAYAKAGSLSQVEEMFEKLKKEGHANDWTFSIYKSACIKAGLYKKLRNGRWRRTKQYQRFATNQASSA